MASFLIVESRPKLWRQPGFRRFWTASTVSDFGTPITTLAIQILVVVNLEASATELGVVNAARWVPYLAFGLFAGVLADRVRHRLRLLGMCQLGLAILLTILPALYFAGLLTLSSVIAVLVAFGAVSVLGDASAQSVLPRLVDRRVLAAANARLEQSGAVAQTSGPLLAGALIRVFGAPLAVLVDACSFLISGGLLLSIRGIEDRGAAQCAAQRHLGREIGEGARWVYRHPMLGPMAIWSHVWFFFNAILWTVFVPYALRELRLGAFGLGIVYACAGVGAVFGGALAGSVGRRFGLGPTVITSQFILAVAFLPIVIAPDGQYAVVFVGVGQLLFGLGIGLGSPHELAYRQAVTPDRLQGRMNATIRSLNWGMIAIGAPLGGLLADLTGYGPALWIGIAGVAVTAVGLLISPVRQASMPRTDVPNGQAQDATEAAGEETTR
jgi:MFS family permease